MRRIVLVLLFAGCASQKPAIVHIPTVAYPFDRTTLAREDVAACSDKILEMGWFGMVEFERAAFLRIRDDGRFDCEIWDSKLKYRRVDWDGPIPDGTVAVIHSHPRTKPDPSEHDIDEAQRIGVPVIVVTPEAVTMAMPRNRQIVRVVRVDSGMIAGH